ncbi:protein phosphatase 2C domain-containing protein [Halomonas sp. I1]|uniref:protein phosphatase 2C domain-containing protein n=1 Tax=Halomonas sp. I1 TaxID=393536 RepID=UPI0028DE21CC|nr:protein phosphatase 2C domain-containing protein [Halomonas sp. I1]MDT8895944.1 protein phosphatase 2C domain-containing protein [Halomonas sp. I1]
MAVSNREGRDAGRLEFRVVDQLTDPDGDANADWLGVARDCVLWMDGAAPINAGRTRSEYPSDAAWLVRRFVGHFLASVDPAWRTRALVIDIQDRLAVEYDALDPAGDVERADLPFACFGAARLVDDTLEVTGAGDCVLLYETDEGRLASFGHSAVGGLEQKAVSSLCEAKARSGASHDAALQSALPHILGNQAQRNRRFGYDVVEPIGDLSIELERVLMPARPGRRLLAMSDGFYRAVDTYHLFTHEQLFDAAFDGGLRDILARLRAAEAEDPEANAHPRLKLQDDATAVAFMVEAY